MFLLLLVAATIYFILGEPRDGLIMLAFVVGIIGIDVIQEWKTDKTLNALKDLSAPHITVIRDGVEQTIAAAPQEDTPLRKQTDKLIKTCAIIAGVLFVLVGMFTWMNIPDHNFMDRLVESILSGVTLAMAMIPEEFPVILTVFLSMGAWRLAKKHSLVRKLSSVETLGAVSVLCVDKTGTITMNLMSVTELWVASGDERSMVEIMGLACETETYDPMEKAMLSCCEAHGITRNHLFEESGFLTEYAFTNELKMMGHVWHHDGEILILFSRNAGT